MQEVFEKIIRRIEVAVKSSDNSNFTNGLLSAQDIIKQEAAEYNNGWIPCSEPPRTGVYMLLSFSNFSVPIVGRYEENEQGGAYYIGDEDETCIQQDMFVDAWQPLPAPYIPHICTNKYCSLNEGKDCPAAEGCAGYERKYTNADRIRSMSDEELAELLDSVDNGGIRALDVDYPCDECTQKTECEDCFKEWLQFEVEE